MSWNEEDNKKYRGYLDDRVVALSEDYEVTYFANAYLNTRGYGNTEENRAKVRAQMKQYPGKAPIKRTDLAAYLDKVWAKK